MTLSRYIEYYRDMLTYDVLAALWSAPATDVEVARAVEDRVGQTLSRNMIDQHLRLLRTTGHVRTYGVDGMPAYALTETGSALLSDLAARMECNEYRVTPTTGHDLKPMETRPNVPL